MFFAMMPAKFGSDKTVALEFGAVCAWELESEMEARGVEPLFAQSMSIEICKRLKASVVQLLGPWWMFADVPTVVPTDPAPSDSVIRILGMSMDT